MNVLKLAAEGELADIHIGFDRVEARDDLLGIGTCDNALSGQHAGVRLRAPDVLGIEALVVVDGGVDFLHNPVGALAEAAAPHLVAHLGFSGSCVRTPQRFGGTPDVTVAAEAYRNFDHNRSRTCGRGILDRAATVQGRDGGRSLAFGRFCDRRDGAFPC